jgi:hypothetical protein
MFSSSIIHYSIGDLFKQPNYSLKPLSAVLNEIAVGRIPGLVPASFKAETLTW